MADSATPVKGLLKALRLHPRVAYQGFFADEHVRDRLIGNLPPLVPFKSSYHAALAIVDWDHRLPSKTLTLRLYLFYDQWTLAAGEQAFDARLEEIGARDRFPEFDVPDFGELPADEVYETEVQSDGSVAQCRLTSPWRREVPPSDGHAAVSVARGSSEFEKIAGAALDRPRHLGDLEAVSWTPPCESGHARWTVHTHEQLDGKLARELENADALIVRSAVQADAKLLEHAKQLRVIGRAGVGVDNIDLDRKSVV
jgi:hypothetical protein